MAVPTACHAPASARPKKGGACRCTKPRVAAPSLVRQLPSDRYSDMKERDRTLFDIEAAVSKWYHQKSVERGVRREVKELKKRTDEPIRRRCRSGSHHVRKGSADGSPVRTARLHHSVGGKRIAKFPRYGNVNRDRLKQWETLEEGVRLSHPLPSKAVLTLPSAAFPRLRLAASIAAWALWSL